MTDFSSVKNSRMPQSIGIIMDGNRRFAKQIMKKPWKGHEFGVSRARKVLKWSDELGIEYLTIYALSVENIRTRPKIELSKILDYFEKELDEVLSGEHVIHETKTRVRFIGRIGLLKKGLRKKMKEVEDLTKDYENHLLSIAVAYGGQQEIVDACKKISLEIMDGVIEPHQINESLFKDSLYTNGFRCPDLIIRTGGERRLSNFLLWQSAYSELAFTDQKWPEFSKKKFVSMIGEYQKRERRFGK